MDLKTKIENFNRRWNLKDDESSEEKFSKFKVRVLNVLKDIDESVTNSSISKFCIAFGIKEMHQFGTFGGVYSTNIISELKRENDRVKFFRLIETIVNLDFVPCDGRNGAFWKEAVYEKLQMAFNFSQINARIEKIEGEILILPAGEKLLDEEVIDHVLSFLDGDTSSHFIDALKYYEQGSKKSRVKSVDHLRRALEEQLRYELKNKKGLKTNIPILGGKLKSISVNNDIKNTVIQLIKSLDNVFNENSKHNDGIIFEPENEYLIYQVALLMRYIHKIMIDES